MFFLGILSTLFSQESAPLEFDSSVTANRRNVVRLNLTPMLVFGPKSIVLGYERQIKPHQTVSVNAGYISPDAFFFDNYGDYVGSKGVSSYGFTIAGDYRRYFKKRNRGFAPDGLYWGGYAAYTKFSIENKLILSDSLGADNSSSYDLTTRIDIMTIGLELGYQFVIKQRLALDLIMLGPGVGFYNADFKGDGDLNLDSDEAKEVGDFLVRKFPGVGELVDTGSFSTNGGFRVLSAGLRFAIQVGYVF